MGDAIPEPPELKRRRSRAWVLYAILAALGVVGVFVPTEEGNRLGALVGAILCGLYARYIYRGGRFVLVPIPGCITSIGLLAVLAVAATSSHWAL